MTVRADHVGSLLRPAGLLQTRADYAQGRLTRDELSKIEDRAILDAIAMGLTCSLTASFGGKRF